MCYSAVHHVDGWPVLSLLLVPQCYYVCCILCVMCITGNTRFWGVANARHLWLKTTEYYNASIPSGIPSLDSSRRFSRSGQGRAIVQPPSSNHRRKNLQLLTYLGKNDMDVEDPCYASPVWFRRSIEYAGQALGWATDGKHAMLHDAPYKRLITCTKAQNSTKQHNITWRLTRFSLLVPLSPR